MANSSRLPECLPFLTHPNTWSNEQTEALWMHIIRGQAGLLDQAEMFQLVWSDDPDVEDTLCEDMAADAKLYYGPRSRIYVARVLAHRPNNIQALEEVICSVPELVSDSSPYVPFNHNLVRHMFEDRCKKYKEIEQLVMDTIDYERVLPVQATRGHWKSMFEACRSFPLDPPPVNGDIAFLGGSWWMQEAFFNVDSQKGRDLQYAAFSTMLHLETLDHQLSQTLLGGPYALKWIVLQLVRYYYTIRMLEEGEQPPYRAKYRPDIQGTRNRIEHDIDHLTRRIEQSIVKLCNLRDNKEHAIPLPALPTGVIHQRRHVQGALLSRSPSPDSILKPAIKKAGKSKRKMKVEVVLTKGKSTPKATTSATAADDEEEMDLDPKVESRAGQSKSATRVDQGSSSDDESYIPSTQDMEDSDTEMGSHGLSESAPGET
ncbi:hypothetical protein FRC10_006954, partial [Ceratobasidium sp. 414]